MLLVARAVQGAFAATMIPASLAILLADTPVERRGNSVALWSAAGAFAAAVGPSVGGVLVHAFGWRSLFVINVPAGTGPGRRGGHPAAHGHRAHPAARRPGHGAAGLRDRPGGAGTVAGLRVGLGRRAHDRQPRRRRRRDGGRDPALVADAGPRDRDEPVEAPDVRVGQRGVAALRRQPVRVDAARRARAHRAVALLRAPGGAGDDAGGDRRERRRPWWSGAAPPRGPRWSPGRR